MKLSLLHRPDVPPSASPYRLVDQQRQEIAWANDFLDAQRIRQCSLCSLRAFGYDLLHFARWWQQHPSCTLLEMNESTLLDYVRDQLNEEPQPTPQTINHRLTVLRSLYRFHSGHPRPTGPGHVGGSHYTRSTLGYGRWRRVVSSRLRLKEPKRVIVPLSAEEVAKFWESFHTFRDLALVALLLDHGLRSREALALKLQDLRLADGQVYAARALVHFAFFDREAIGRSTTAGEDAKWRPRVIDRQCTRILLIAMWKSTKCYNTAGSLHLFTIV